jgi:hypothetical protein
MYNHLEIILDEWFGIEELNTTESYMKHYKPLREYIDSLKTYLDANWEMDWRKVKEGVIHNQRYEWNIK